MSLEHLRQIYPVIQLIAGDFEVNAVRTGGDGKPIILLPGAQGTSEIFFKQLLAWGGKRNMLSLTYPPLTDPELLAENVVALANKLQLQSFDIIGSSYGGYLAQWISVKHGERVGKLVIGNSFQDPRPAQSPEKLQGLEVKSGDELKAEAVARLAAMPDNEFRHTMLDLVGSHQPASTLRSRMIAVQKAVPVPSLSIDNSRLLIIECDNDPLISAPMRDAIRLHYSGAKHCTINGGGHYPYLLKPDEYNAEVAAFLEI